MPTRHILDVRLAALHLIHFAILLYVYTNYIVDLFGYAGFVDAFNITKTIWSPFALVAALALIRNSGLPSYFFLNIIVALTVTPSFVLFSGSDLPFEFIAVTWGAFALLATVAAFARVRRLRAPRLEASTLLRWLAALSVTFIGSIFALGGGRFLNFDLTRVYDFRRDASANLPGLFEYLSPTFSKAIAPLGIVLSFIGRKWFLLFVFVFCSVMVFALSNHKLPLFIPTIVIFIYWLSRSPRALHNTLLALIAVVAIGGMDLHFMQSGVGGIAGLFGSLAVRRAILLPSLLNWLHCDFFSVNPYTYWADSKFTLGLVDAAYDVGSAALIGREVFGADVRANTGWIGSGMANAGYCGLALYSVGIGLLLSLLDAYAARLGHTLVLAVFMMPVVAIATSADLTTMLLTHGLLVLLLLVILLKPTSEHCPVQRRLGA